MGILDKRTRFIDLVVTQEGKRQIANGQLRAEFASLSDSNLYYDSSNKEDISQRIYFEVMERPENSIVLEKDDSGNLINLDMSPTGSIVGNAIFLKDQQEAARLSLNAVTGSDFKIGMQSVLDSSLEHFRKNYFIGTFDTNGSNEFSLDKDKVTFTITNDTPFSGSPYKEVINVNDAEPFFLDSKLAHLDNFQYLPPISNTTGATIGDYEDIRSTKRDSWEDIKKLLAGVKNKRSQRNANYSENLVSRNRVEYKSEKLIKNGKVPEIEEYTPVEIIRFDKTSTDNNLILQVYEDSIGPEMNKLDVIDAGTFYDYEDNMGRQEKRVFYVGKVYYDDFNMPTFVNIFTIVMD